MQKPQQQQISLQTPPNNQIAPPRLSRTSPAANHTPIASRMMIQNSQRALSASERGCSNSRRIIYSPSIPKPRQAKRSTRQQIFNIRNPVQSLKVSPKTPRESLRLLGLHCGLGWLQTGGCGSSVAFCSVSLLLHLSVASLLRMIRSHCHVCQVTSMYFSFRIHRSLCAQCTNLCQLNTIISILANIARVSLLMAVAATISQNKWLWFYKDSHKLPDIQCFEEASRGPWGSFIMLVRLRGR